MSSEDEGRDLLEQALEARLQSQSLAMRALQIARNEPQLRYDSTFHSEAFHLIRDPLRSNQ